MTPAPGARLGPYEILSPLGAGGMGEVWKAKDTRLDRFVAVKVLPEHLVENADALARFEREAKAVAALNHPNILALHDLGNQDGVVFAVMELLEGESLRDRLTQGPLPPRKATDLAVQLAQGLAAAHEKGVIHRDLKPDNLWITKDGRLKILDFGLAKQVMAPKHGSQSFRATEAVSPGHVLHTEEGMILGTMGYMSPEQVRGANVDARSDLFSFGTVLFEMLTCRKAFTRETAPETMVAILKEDPQDFESACKAVSPGLQRVLHHCLEKDPAHRFQNAHDLAFALGNLASSSDSSATFTPPFAPQNRWTTWKWAALSGLLLAAAAFTFFRPRAAAPESRTIRFNLNLPANAAGGTFNTTRGSFAVSPDGKRIAFTAVDPNGRSQLYLRALDALEDKALPGTEEASRPFWSPDGKQIGFFARGKLKAIDPLQGHAVELAEVAGGLPGAAWLPDGGIVVGLFIGGLVRVPPGGGVPVPFVPLDAAKGERGLRWPKLLPDGKHIVFLSATLDPKASSIDVVTIEGKDRRKLVSAVSEPFAAAGFLLYGRDGALIAQRLDTKRMALSGEPVVVQDPVSCLALFGIVFAAATDDVLVYRAAGASTTRLVWFDRSGKELSAATPPGLFTHLDLSKDETHFTAERLDPHTGLGEIWVGDLARSTLGRVTSGSDWNWMPIWSPDANRLVYGSTRSHITDLYVNGEGGTGPEELLYADSARLGPEDFSRDGRTLVYQRLDPKLNQIDLWALPMTGEKKPTPLVVGSGSNTQARLSPDGHLLAYVSREAESPEVFVIPVPPTGAKWQVSTRGGVDPQWRSDGKELFYIAPDRELMAVPVALGAAFRAGVPQRLFATRVPDPSDMRRSYAPSADGSRFLVLTVTDPEWPPPITVVVGWANALRR